MEKNKRSQFKFGQLVNAISRHRTERAIAKIRENNLRVLRSSVSYAAGEHGVEPHTGFHYASKLHNEPSFVTIDRSVVASGNGRIKDRFNIICPVSSVLDNNRHFAVVAVQDMKEAAA